MEVIAMTHSLCIVSVHIVFSTKDRHKWLTKKVQPQMWSYLSEVLCNMGCREIVVRGVEDHVHALSNLGKRCAPAALIQDLKADSSKWVKTLDDALASFYWQTGYGMFSVGPRERDIVRDYILRQEE